MSPYQGYTSKEVSKLLRRSVEMLRQAGILDSLKKSYPFESEHLPLYDIEEVEKWQTALLRRDGLVALGRRQRTEPLKKALRVTAKHDTKCPRCGGWAMADPKAGEGLRRVWCPECDVVELVEK